MSVSTIDVDAAAQAVQGRILQGLSTERLEAQITTLAGHLAASMCEWLLLVAEYDRRRAYESWECVSTVQWLGVHVGISAVTARQHVAVGRRLDELPKVREAFSKGEVSFSRVRAICRIATPVTEGNLLDMAKVATAAQLDRIVADTARALRVKEPGHGDRQTESRRLSWYFDDDGMCQVRGVLPPEVGALLASLVDEERVDDREIEYGQRNVDAFATVLVRARSWSDGGTEPRPLVVLHRYPDGVDCLEHGPAVAPETADRLSCDADHIDAVHTDPGHEDPGHVDPGHVDPGHVDPGDVDPGQAKPGDDAGIRYGRRRRFPTRVMRRRLQERDGGCVFPGCGHRRRVNAHHVDEFVRDRGDTVVANLILLCAKHHRAVHDGRWTIDGNAQTGWRFHRPDGAVFGPSESDSTPGDIVTMNARHGASPGPSTIVPSGLGERYDHELTIWALTNYWPNDAAASPTMS